MKRDAAPARAFYFLVLVGALPAVSAGPASVSKTDLSRCAGIDAAAERLACYDALAGRGASAAHAALPAATSQAPGADAKNPAVPADAKGFGLTKPVQAMPAGPERIEARVVKVAASQFGAASVQLDNGQTWALAESNGAIAAGDTVVIKRASLGSYLMMTPAKRSFRVRRLQ